MKFEAAPSVLRWMDMAPRHDPPAYPRKYKRRLRQHVRLCLIKALMERSNFNQARRRIKASKTSNAPTSHKGRSPQPA